MSDQYILGGPDGRTPVPVDDILEWGQAMQNMDRRVAKDLVANKKKDLVIRISTVFLATDHSFSGSGPPILWETMVFIDKGRDINPDLH